MIQQKLNEEIKTAQKAGNAERLSVLRFLMAQVKNREIEKRGTGSADPLTEEELTAVFQKEAKKRREAIDLYTQGGRPELAATEKTEMDIIHEFIPAPMGREEVMKAVEKAKAAGASDFNTLMKESMKELKGRADGKLVGEVVKEVLG
jgi:uncharacterized protein